VSGASGRWEVFAPPAGLLPFGPGGDSLVEEGEAVGNIKGARVRFGEGEIDRPDDLPALSRIDARDREVGAERGGSWAARLHAASANPARKQGVQGFIGSPHSDVVILAI